MDRLSDYRAVARAEGVDALALVPGPNFERLFGASFHSHERPLVVVIPVEGAPAAIVPNLELQSFEAVQFEGAVFDWRDQDGFAAAFAALAAHMPLRSLAVEGQVMRVFVHHALARAFPGLEIVDAEAGISGLRRVKTPEEIAILERAIATSERALSDVLDQVRIGQTEAEIESLLIQALFRHGADSQAFGPIVAAGENAARPHAHARPDYRIADGDVLLFDFGAHVGGMNADITRTVFVGHVPDAIRPVYHTVLEANRAGLAATGPGATAHEVDDAATGVLEASPFSGLIRHKTGHGLGRAVHEAPQIMRGNHETLAPGMVLTIEPGLYEPGSFGIRIEDDVLVTETGCRALTTFPRELRIIGQC